LSIPSEYLTLLAGFPVVTEISVLWGDQDAFGHVNNVAYLRWVETARVEYFRDIGLGAPVAPTTIGPILATQTCHYRRPLNYPDTIVIGTRVTAIGNSSLRMEHKLISRAAGEIAAESDSVIVTVDYTTGRPVRVPDAIRQAVGKVEGREFV
jgi:acyl-CoA thioester hydrolase